MIEIMLKITVISIVFLIFHTITNLKFKYFIPEIYSGIRLAIVCFIIFCAGLFDSKLTELYILGLIVALVVILIVLKKNKIYYFKGIYKKFIISKENEILQILEDYKFNNLDNEASVHLQKYGIVFKKLGNDRKKECLDILENYLDVNIEEYTINNYLFYYFKSVVLPVIIPLVVVFVSIKINNYQLHIDVSEKISIKDENLSGNSVGNVKNYGIVTETDDYIYFANDYKIYKTDKELKNEVVLTDIPVSSGKDTLNVVEDWIFYRTAEKINRVKTDGTGYEILFRGYSLHPQILGNWIYFISVSDGSKICKIDVNGQSKQFLTDKYVEDMAIYNEKIYYSYKDKEDEFLEVMNIDGTNNQFLSNIITNNMIVDEKYIYYLDEEEILYQMNLEDKTKKTLSNEQISKFIKDENYIYYTLKVPGDPDWCFRFKGLYRMDIDGSNVVAIDDEIYLDEMGMGVTKDYIFYISVNEEQSYLKIINK